MSSETNNTNANLHADIVGLRKDIQATNHNMERIATTLEKSFQDHETRLRALEQDNFKQKGVLGLVKWVGAGNIFVWLVAILYFTSKSGGLG